MGEGSFAGRLGCLPAGSNTDKISDREASPLATLAAMDSTLKKSSITPHLEITSTPKLEVIAEVEPDKENKTSTSSHPTFTLPSKGEAHDSCPITDTSLPTTVSDDIILEDGNSYLAMIIGGGHEYLLRLYIL